MMHLKTLRSTLWNLYYWLKELLTSHLYMTLIFPYGLPQRIGTFFYQLLRMLMRTWWENFMQMPLLKERRSNVGLEKKVFSVSPIYLAEIQHINRPILPIPLVYDELNLDEEILREALGNNLEFSSNGKSISVASLSHKLRLLTTIMCSNLYPLSSTGFINLGWTLFLHDLISDVEIDVCSHIFHILAKTFDRTASRNCIPFCRLISRILKLKGVYPLKNEHPYTRPSPISIYTFHANISHTKKNPKQESLATQGSSSSTSHVYDQRLDSILVTF